MEEPGLRADTGSDAALGDVCVIVPMLNEASVIEGVVKGLLEAFPLVVCVDDGSTDDCGARARAVGARVVTHPVNLGQGAALQTGIDYALRIRPTRSLFVTFDADGQHRVEDARRMVEAARAGDVDVVLGSRFLAAGDAVPTMRRLLLRAAVLFTRLTTRMPITDAHNGLRVLNRSVAELIDIRLRGMAHASELLEIISRSGASWKELPVTIDYTDYTRGKGQSGVNAVNILLDLVLGRLDRGRR